MIGREKAVKRCRECKYCHAVEIDGYHFLGCQICANKWIVEVEQCPLTEIKD